MPTYDYECKACGHHFEKFQSITAGPSRKCPECGKLKAKRLLGTGAGIIFKGSGFYQTDYRSESYRKEAEADKPTTSDKDKGDSKSTESKSQNSTATTKAKSEDK